MKLIKNSFIVFITIFFLFPLVVLADSEKVISVKLSKDYVSATFKVEMESSINNCTAVVVNPDGLEYEATPVNSDTWECVVNNVISGNWLIRINTLDGTDVGSVDVTVEGSKAQMVDGTSDIKVASDIVGLKVYMKDDYLVAEWSDNSCGSVRLSVADAKSLQVLDEKTVSSSEPCYYEYKTSGEVELLITIVPSTSSNIQGASTSFSISTYYNPAASIQLEADKETNQAVTYANVTLKGTYQVMCYVNGKLYSESDLLEQGEYAFELPVSSGNNFYDIYIVDVNHNMRSYSFSCNGDFVAPKLTVMGSSKKIEVSKEIFHLEGTISDFSKLTVNGKEVEKIYDDGVFEYDYLLHEGENVIEIDAYDSAGNVSSCSLMVVYAITDYSIYVIIGVIIVLLVLIVILSIFLIRLAIAIRNEEKNKDVNNSSVENNNESNMSELVPFSNTPANVTESVSAVKAPTNLKEPISFGNTSVNATAPVPPIHATSTPKTKEKASSKKHKKVSIHSKWNWIISPCMIGITLFLLLRFMIATVIIQSNSMEPIIQTGDAVIINRLSYLLNDVQRGDIIFFWSEEEKKYLGKRVIGLPGDEIRFRDGYVVINNLYMDESSYLIADMETNCNREFVVPEDGYFVLGDNRENSKDSRYFENPYVMKEDILGKYMGFSGINMNMFGQ